MGIPKDLLTQIGHALRPLATRVANMVARGVVELADDTKKMQLLQLGVLEGDPVDAAEFFQAYGFSSVPLAGAEAVVLFPNGDRSHPIVIAATDRANRPTGGEPGQVTVHHYKGARVIMTADGNVEVRPGAGGQVYIRDAGGTADALVKKSEFNAHVHATAGTGTPSVPTVLATGTTKLQAE